MRRKIYVSQFADEYLRENFKTIGTVFNNNPFLKGEWKFLEFQVKATNAALKIPHTLEFTPRDTILLSTIGGTVIFNYTGFDSTFISLNATVTATPMTVRLLVGRYTEDTINV